MIFKGLKNRYDKALKDLVNKPELFRDDANDVYYKKRLFYSEIVQQMSESDYDSYQAGAGGDPSAQKISITNDEPDCSASVVRHLKPKNFLQMTE